MGQNRRRTSRRSADDKIKYIRMAAIPLLNVIVLVIIIVVMDKKPSDKQTAAPGTETSADAGHSSQDSQGQKDQGQEEQSQDAVAPDNSQYTTDFSDYELQKDEIPQVNLIISEYFQAKVDQDAEKLFQLFGKATDESLNARKDELKNEAVYIEDYQDIVCYTKPGLTEESYVVYVTYEVKFRRVDTLAPGLMWCYVLKDDSGNYIIRENVVGDEADYVAKQNQSEDVRLLSNQVNERLRQAIESDTLLAGIYKDLRNGAVVSNSEEDGQDSFVSLEDGGSDESGNDGTQADDSRNEGSQDDSAVSPESGSPAGENGSQGQGLEGQSSEGQGLEGQTASSGQEPAEGTTGGSNVKIE